MITIQGLYNTAVCYTPELEEAARKQIQTVCDQAEFAGCKIRIMPDVHAGKGCTIGTTMTIQDKIVPGMVGVDIGCGMETVELREREVDFEKLDALIRREIPYGREVRDIPHALNAEIDLTHLRCTDQVNLNRAMRSIGSLGGGNHFIEVDRAEDGRLFLVVHSGSRHLGTEVAEHYQNEGRRALWGGAQYQVQAAIDQLKAEGRFQEIQKTIKALKKEHELNIPKDLAYVEGKLFEDYIHDMKLTHNTAVCYTPELEEAARKQIQTVCDQAEFAGCKIRIMPDVHAGKGCTIGTTMTIQDKIVPGMVGVDIGCGMETVELREREVDFEKLDALIRREIPYGREVRDIPHALNAEIDLTHLRCTDQVNLNRAMRSIGSLGGGNHFIEVDRAEDGRLFLVVHSGSRHLGTEVAEHYQNEGRRALWGGAQYQVQAAIDQLKAEGRFQEIQKTIKALKKEHELNIPKDLAYVEGKLFEDYIHDMKLTQQFAMLNRKAMVDVIMTGMGFTAVETFTTIHNYIDTDAMILRKGSVSAKAGEKLLIPINMRDGSLICSGKGNEDWNCSAPHGAGRLMSRKAAFNALSMEEFQKEMEGIYTTCVVPDTLDESPMAYKSMEEIVAQIGPTAEIIERIRPVYNFKAAD